MRTIHKGAEPPCLTQHRQTPHADYENYQGKDTLRQALVTEQRGLCCYCQSRIRATPEGMKIEHWQSQSDHPTRQLDFGNLHGACLGGQGQPERDQHCDTRKGNSVLCFSVCDPERAIERQIKFLGDGRISSDDPAINSAVNHVLNLNLSRLVDNRKAVLEAFKQRLGKGPLNAAQELKKWDGTNAGELREFAQVMVFWLNRKISRG
jgi:uncharacterized protein (TIGR02646 family)